MVWHLAWEYLKIQQNEPVQNEINRLQQIKRELEQKKFRINYENKDLDNIDEQIDEINDVIRDLKETLFK
tara:strand:+ start:703 stop:912 length:210 start_codon:yes stop_codon:yes gene_type:complete